MEKSSQNKNNVVFLDIDETLIYGSPIDSKVNENLEKKYENFYISFYSGTAYNSVFEEYKIFVRPFARAFVKTLVDLGFDVRFFTMSAFKYADSIRAKFGFNSKKYPYSREYWKDLKVFRNPAVLVDNIVPNTGKQTYLPLGSKQIEIPDFAPWSQDSDDKAEFLRILKEINEFYGNIYSVDEVSESFSRNQEQNSIVGKTK